jgi:hypothetical protein
MVNGHTVNLSPLIQWWSAPKGIRPLSSWKHVRGSIAQDSPLGWIIVGKPEGENRASKFFLKNPPRERLRKFHELRPRLAEYEQARTAALEKLGRPVHTWYDWLWRTQPGANGISLEEYRQTSAQLAELDRNIHATQAELAPLQDEHGEFKVDVFALHTNEQYQGLPVFNYGLAQPFQ